MSLLHEALKKAERAKEEAQRPAKRAELSSVPLEIAGEPEPPRDALPLVLEPEPTRDVPEAPEPQPGDFAATASIEEELGEPSPNRPFHVALGALGIAVIATVGFFWYQLRPAPAIIPSQSPPIAAPVPAMDSPAPAGKVSLPGLPNPVVASAPQPEPVQAAAAPSPAQRASERATPAARAAARPAAPIAEDVAEPQESPRPPAVARAAVIHPRVQSGYAAYQTGDLGAATADYEQALREDAGNRDALLGLAALETRAQRYEHAEAHYRRVLQSDARDPYALAGLHSMLGNRHARQGRWDEARLAYSKAQAADAGNPDFAFNLAVSLDQLHQPAAALAHYRRALELAATRTAHFSLESARQRVRQLSR